MAVASDRAAGAHHHSQQDRHRQFLANLERKKALERQAAERLRDKEKEELERGFQMCFNGANRELGKPKQQQQQQQQQKRPVTRGATARAFIRTPGALPINHARTAHQQREAEELPREGRIEANEAGEASPETGRRARRQWVLGEPILLRAASGEMLQFDPCREEREAQAEAPAPAHVVVDEPMLLLPAPSSAETCSAEAQTEVELREDSDEDMALSEAANDEHAQGGEDTSSLPTAVVLQDLTEP